MAKIEMDLSEYERIQENKRLLEDSLKREKELQSKNELLNKEKIQILEDAKMKVVKVKRVEKQDHVVCRRSPFDIAERLRDFFLTQQYSNASLDRMSNYINSIIEGCFEIRPSVITGTEEFVTTHGLDEVREELRAELATHYEELIKKANDKENIFSKLIKEKETAEAERVMYSEANEAMRAQIELLEKEYKDIKKLYLESQEHLTLIGGLSKVPVTIFTAKKILTNIKNYYEKSTINQSLDTSRKNEASANA